MPTGLPQLSRNERQPKPRLATNQQNKPNNAYPVLMFKVTILPQNHKKKQLLKNLEKAEATPHRRTLQKKPQQKKGLVFQAQYKLETCK